MVRTDGSLRDLKEEKMECVSEIKCQFPKKGLLYRPIQHNTLPKYYAPQFLSEMVTLKCQKLLYVCYTPESTNVLAVTFSEDVWKCLCTEADVLYGDLTPRRPKKKYANV